VLYLYESMKHFILIAFVAFTLSLVSGAQAQSLSQDKGADVRKLERSWLDAYEKHDVAAMTAIVADDFVITFPDGSQQTKPQILRMIGRPVVPEQAMKFRTEDVKTRVYGDTVILSGRVITESTRDGKLVTEQQTYTDTYVRRDGKWQVVASHLSNVAPPKPVKN